MVMNLLKEYSLLTIFILSIILTIIFKISCLIYNHLINNINNQIYIQYLNSLIFLFLIKIQKYKVRLSHPITLQLNVIKIYKIISKI
jgi:hypothetical protein